LVLQSAAEGEANDASAAATAGPYFIFYIFIIEFNLTKI
jgi:hypothetical protein